MSSQNQKAFPLYTPLLKKSRVFVSVNHASNISRTIHTFYVEKQFLDTVLIAGVDSIKFQAHRIVLSSRSEFFLRMFHTALQSATTEGIVLRDIDGITLKSIIDFIYTGIIDLQCETVESILVAADFLQIDPLVDACCDFMGDQLDACNCLGVALFAEPRNYYVLHKKASSFAYAHFAEVCTQEEFIQLNEEQLCKFLSSDDLMCPEENVFRSVVAWVNYDQESRERLLFTLLAHVRFTLLKPKFIIENRHSVSKTIECCELMRIWLQWHLTPESRSLFSTQNTKGKRASKKLAYVVGTSITYHGFEVHTFNPELNTWVDQGLPSPFFEQRIDYAIAVINEKLIIAGGKINGYTTNSVECFDLQTKKWIELPPMRLRTSLPGIAEFNGELYVVGGCIDRDWSSHVEKYDFSTKEWEDVTPLNLPLTSVKVAVGDRLLYAAGHSFDSIQYYDIGANKWTQVANKNEKYEHFGIAAVNGNLYAVGGCVDGKWVKAVERYNPSTDAWSMVKSLNIARSDVTCVVLNSQILACGGSGCFQHSVE